MYEQKQYDLVIIGGGPAGLTAGLYAARAKINTVLLEKAMAGGQITNTCNIENYPGLKKISGMDLALQMEQQAREFGLQIEICDVKKVYISGDQFWVETACAKYKTQAVILTAGVRSRQLDVPGEKAYKGRGVSYCAVCDGFFYNGKNVAVIGGGDAALEEGMYLTKYAEKVFIIHRRDSLKAQRYLQEKARENPKIEFIWNTVIDAIKGDGDGVVTNMELRDVITGEKRTMPIDGIFVYIGAEPSEIINSLNLKTDDQGFIITDTAMMTSIPGIFAAGDIRSKPLRQIVTAVGDGAIAAISAEKYIEEKHEEKKQKEKKEADVSKAANVISAEAIRDEWDKGAKVIEVKMTEEDKLMSEK